MDISNGNDGDEKKIYLVATSFEVAMCRGRAFKEPLRVKAM